VDCGAIVAAIVHIARQRPYWQGNQLEASETVMLKLHNLHNAKLNMHERKSFSSHGLCVESCRKQADQKMVDYAEFIPMGG
jgi:hypothetical protein